MSSAVAAVTMAKAAAVPARSTVSFIVVVSPSCARVNSAQGDGPRRPAKCPSAVKRPAVRGRPADRGGGADRKVLDAGGVRHLDDEVGIAVHLHPAADVIAEVDKLENLCLDP